MGSWAHWAEATDDAPDEPKPAEPDEQETEATVDDTFEARRLRRWLRAMFGGRPSADEPDAGS